MLQKNVLDAVVVNGPVGFANTLNDVETIEGKLAEAKATLVGQPVKFAVAFTLGVATMSCAATKYCMLLPVTGVLVNKLKSKLNV